MPTPAKDKSQPQIFIQYRVSNAGDTTLLTSINDTLSTGSYEASNSECHSHAISAPHELLTPVTVLACLHLLLYRTSTYQQHPFFLSLATNFNQISDSATLSIV